MDIIIKERGHGKTAELVRMSAQNKIPIISLNPDYIRKLANELGVEIPEPIYVFDVRDGKVKHLLRAYIDEVEFTLQALLGFCVEGFTYTINDG